MRSEVRSTTHARSCLENDEGYKLSGADEWEDNDSLSMTDVFKMTEVSSDASVVLYPSV